MKVGIIDYGIGNLGSVVGALQELQANFKLITQPKELSLTEYLILPGVGSYSDCANLLSKDGWTEAIKEQVIGNGKPLLGVCVGMQLLANYGTEGIDDSSVYGVPGLGLVPGRVEHLRSIGCKLRVPHVGWNSVFYSEESCDIFDQIPQGTDFYFVHSYGFIAENPLHVLATTDYDIPVTAAVRNGNVWGTQFHPEKSSLAGFRLIDNFIREHQC